jgi:hypothetical protein
MATRRLVLSRLAAAAAGAALVGGCGTAAAPTVSRSARVPAGFTLYRGNGFSLAVPTDFKVAPFNIPGLPAGAATTVLTAGGSSATKANTTILLATNPNLQYTVDQVASNLRKADASNSLLTDVNTSVSPVSVAGAQQARIVTETFVNKAQAGAGLVHRTWLMVSPRRGTLIDIVVGVEPQAGGTLSPNKVFNSFRLDR